MVETPERVIVSGLALALVSLGARENGCLPVRKRQPFEAGQSCTLLVPARHNTDCTR
jgi:hypothetical protein